MLRDLIVHLDGASEDDVRLSHAEMIARDSGAHILGLYTNYIPDFALKSGFDIAFTSVAITAQLQAQARETGDEVFARLKERVVRLEFSNRASPS